MTITAHTYQLYIKAPADTVWDALTNPELTRRYFHGTAFVEPPQAGKGFRTIITEAGIDAVDGVVEELTPPTATSAGRFVHTWHFLYDPELAAETPGRVEWIVEPLGPELTRLQLIHGDLAHSPKTWAYVKGGWVWILHALKTLVESNQDLPAPDFDPAEEQSASAGDWHRMQGVEANNAVWELLNEPASPTRDEELLRRAYAAAYHWQRAASATPHNEARASYMIAKALLATDQPARALTSAQRCLAVCQEHQIADFDLVYALEAVARAQLALGDTTAARETWSRAADVTIADPEDKAVCDADVADLSAQLHAMV